MLRRYEDRDDQSVEFVVETPSVSKISYGFGHPSTEQVVSIGTERVQASPRSFELEDHDQSLLIENPPQVDNEEIKQLDEELSDLNIMLA